MSKLTAKKKREEQAAGFRYGCYCDLEPDMKPDGCVKDYGADGDCLFASRHKTREGCAYWLPITPENDKKYGAASE